MEQNQCDLALVFEALHFASEKQEMTRRKYVV